GDVFGALRQHIAQLERKIVIAAYSDGSRDRLIGMMNHAGIPAKYETTILALEHGFVANDLAVLTEQDILGDRLTRRTRKKKSNNFLTEVSSLNVDDLVVHNDHGVGR